MATLLERIRRPSVTNQPPTQQEILRSDLATIGWFALILIFAVGLRNGAAQSQTRVELPDGLPAIAIPKNWVQGSSDELAFFASDPASPSQFGNEVQVYTRPTEPGADLATLRPAWGMARSQALDHYRELNATPVTLLGGTPGLVVSYAYVADPARPVGAAAPPVVVQASDLIFVKDDKLVVVTVAADATAWDAAQNDFGVVFDSLKVEEAQGIEEVME